MLIGFALAAFAADEFPLTLRVLATSETTREYKRLYPDSCITAGLGAPCRTSEAPGWPVDVLKVNGRITHRGRTTEYELVCKSSAPRRSCAALKSGEYRARWRGKRLEVQVPDGGGRSTVNRFEVKGERRVDID